MFHLLVVVLVLLLVVVVRPKWRANYPTDCADIFTEDSPSTLVMQISCIARFV